MIKIEKRSVGLDFPPIVVAEMSGNHGGSLEKALELVDAAAGAGAHALKLQTYKADLLTLDSPSSDFVIKDPKSPWYGQTLYGLYQKSFTPWEWHEQIMSRAIEKGMMCFSTPFDETAVEFLEFLNVPAYKIASFENNHYFLSVK